jgi:hypothetical protein
MGAYISTCTATCGTATTSTNSKNFINDKSQTTGT